MSPQGLLVIIGICAVLAILGFIFPDAAELFFGLIGAILESL